MASRIDERSKPFPQIPSRFLPTWLWRWSLVWLPSFWGWDNQKWREHDSWFLGWITAFNWQIGLRRRAGAFPFPFLSVWMGGKRGKNRHFYFPFPARMVWYFGYQRRWNALKKEAQYQCIICGVGTKCRGPEGHHRTPFENETFYAQAIADLEAKLSRLQPPATDTERRSVEALKEWVSHMRAEGWPQPTSPFRHV